MDKSLSKLWVVVKDREVWHAVVYGVQSVRQNLATESESVSHSVLSPWTVACQAPLFMEFSKQEYWSGLPVLSLRYLPHPGMEPASPAFPALQADCLLLSHRGSPLYLEPLPCSWLLLGEMDKPKQAIPFPEAM